MKSCFFNRSNFQQNHNIEFVIGQLQWEQPPAQARPLFLVKMFNLPLSFGKPGCTLAEALPSCPTPGPHGSQPQPCCKALRGTGYLQGGRPGGMGTGARCRTLSGVSGLRPAACPDPLFMCCQWRLHDETLVGGDRGGWEASVTQKVAGQGQQDAYLASGVGVVRLTAD